MFMWLLTMSVELKCCKNLGEMKYSQSIFLACFAAVIPSLLQASFHLDEGVSHWSSSSWPVPSVGPKVNLPLPLPRPLHQAPGRSERGSATRRKRRRRQKRKVNLSFFIQFSSVKAFICESFIAASSFFHVHSQWTLYNSFSFLQRFNFKFKFNAIQLTLPQIRFSFVEGVPFHKNKKNHRQTSFRSPYKYTRLRN